MNELKRFSQTEFPLGQSLFWMDGNTPSSTWDWLARDWDDAKRERMYKKLIQYKTESKRPTWTMMFMFFNMADAKNGMVNPFLNCPTAKQIADNGGWQHDPAEVTKWQRLLNIGTLPDINLAGCLLCGDDKATTSNDNFLLWYLPIAVRFLAPYVKIICICSEPPKSMNKARQEAIIGLVKNTLQILGRTDIYVVTHLQGNQIKTDLPSNADAVMYQFSRNPWNAHERSVDDVCDEGRSALLNCPVPLCFFELGVYCESQRVREQTRTLAALPGCLMLPGPK